MLYTLLATDTDETRTPYLASLSESIFSNFSDCGTSLNAWDMWKYCLPGTGELGGVPCDDGSSEGTQSPDLAKLVDAAEEDLEKEYFTFKKRHDNQDAYWIKYRGLEKPNGDQCTIDDAIDKCNSLAEGMCRTAFSDVNTNLRPKAPITTLGLVSLVVVVSF